MLTKENKSLREENLGLQTSLREMIPGFSNTSSNFPIQNELVAKIAEFYKQQCLNMFFDFLCPEININGVLFFFSTSFKRLEKLIKGYFDPALESLQKTGCFDTL